MERKQALLNSIEKGHYGVLAPIMESYVKRYPLLQRLLSIVKCILNVWNNNTPFVYTDCLVKRCWLAKFQNKRDLQLVYAKTSAFAPSIYRDLAHLKEERHLSSETRVAEYCHVEFVAFIRAFMEEMFRTGSAKTMIPSEICALCARFAADAWTMMLPYAEDACSHWFQNEPWDAFECTTELSRARRWRTHRMYVCVSLVGPTPDCYGDVVPLLEMRRASIDDNQQ